MSNICFVIVAEKRRIMKEDYKETDITLDEYLTIVFFSCFNLSKGDFPNDVFASVDD